MTKKKTLGQVATELKAKSIDDTHSAHEQMEECLTEWDVSLYQCVEDGKIKHKGISDTFYVVVITKKERLLDNVLRNYFFSRISCPTPDYDQTVYKYTFNDDIVDFIWTIPSRDACYMMTDNPLVIPAEERQLLQFVLDFADGTLFKLCKKLNGEELASPMLEEK